MKRAPVLALLGTDLLARTSYGLCRTPVLPLWAASLGAGPAEIGAVGAAATCTGLVLKFPAGAMSDVVGRRPLILFGLLVFAAGPHLYPLVGALGALAAVRLFHGLATAVYGPVSMAAVASVAGDRKGEILSWLSNTKIAGSLLGAVLGGWILSGVPGVPGAVAGTVTAGDAEFRTAWTVAAWLGGVALVLGAIGISSPAAGTGGTGKRGAWVRFTAGLRASVRNRALLLVSATEGLQNVSVGLLEQFLPVYAVLVAGLSPFEAGVLFGVQTLSTIVTKPVFGRISDRHGRRGLVIAGLLACALPLAALPWATSFPALLGIAFVFGLGEALVTSSAGALAADVADREGLGAAMGAFGTIGDAGHAAGPVLGGFLLAAFGWTKGINASDAASAFRPCFAVVAAGLIVVAVLFARSRTAAAASARTGPPPV